jgi:hypothetical protein
VLNGYGSGNYRESDTVHIWSRAIPANTVFNRWIGDVGTVNARDEWHSTLVMPGANISVTATFTAVSPWSLRDEQIQGADTLKRVLSYFPTPTKDVDLPPDFRTRR